MVQPSRKHPKHPRMIVPNSMESACLPPLGVRQHARTGWTRYKMPVIAILQVVVDKHTIETRPSCIFFASTVMKQPVWHSPIPEAKAIIEVIAFGVVIVFKAIDNHANSNRKNCKSALINMRHKL